MPKSSQVRLVFAKWVLPKPETDVTRSRGPETALGEINANPLEADFWPGTISGSPVTRQESLEAFRGCLGTGTLAK
jgi:hypothetical protein